MLIKKLSYVMVFSTYIFETQCCSPVIFQTMNSAGSNGQSLQYQRFTPPGCKDKGMRKFDFIGKNSQLL